MAERMIEANGVVLCTVAFGDPRDVPILLIMPALLEPIRERRGSRPDPRAVHCDRDPPGADSRSAASGYDYWASVSPTAVRARLLRSDGP